MLFGKSLFYVACLGSKRTHEVRIARLIGNGLDPNQVSKFWPAGYDIGAKTPSEIAVSIMAQLIEKYRGIQGS